MIDHEKVKTICIVMCYSVMSVFIVLKNNEKETKIHLPPIVDYVFQCINGVLLFIAFNAKKIQQVLELKEDDKQMLEDIKNNQLMINDNIHAIITSRSHLTNTEPINDNNTEFIQIPRNLLNHKGKVQCGDYMIQINDTAR
jgi:hypothetical protein